MTKKKFYVVWAGVRPGIYATWAEAQAQVKGYPGARYQAFSSETEAKDAYSHGPAAPSPGKKAAPRVVSKNKTGIVWESVSVDAACSGNPGKMEYQGVDTRSGTRFFHQAFPLGTNNIGEFLAIVHALAMLKKQGSALPIYSDSRNAMKWVRTGKCKTTLVRNAKTEALYSLIERAENWLAQHTFTNSLLKWETEQWGEIPADFGRK